MTDKRMEQMPNMNLNFNVSEPVEKNICYKASKIYFCKHG